MTHGTPITLTIVQLFNGEPGGFKATTHTVRTLRGLERILNRRSYGNGWSLRLAGEGEAPSGSASVDQVIAWVAEQLGSRRDFARSWLHQRGASCGWV